MPAKKTTKKTTKEPTKKGLRTYTARIRHDSEIGELLEQNHNNWQKLYAIGYDRVATIFGSYFPIGENLHQKPNKIFDVFEDKMQVFKTITTFVNWFPAEATTPENKDYAIGWHEAIDLFREYWRDEFGPVSEEVLQALPSMKLKDGVHLVNRRAKFIDSGLIPTKVQEAFLSSNGLHFKGAFLDGNKAINSWGDIITTCFPKIKKDPYNWDIDIVKGIESFVENYEDEETVLSSDVVSYLSEQKIPLKNGSGTPSVYRKILNDESFKAGKMKKYLNNRYKAIEKNKGKKSIQLPSNFREFIISPVESLVPFAKHGSFYYQVYGLPCEQIYSHRTNATRRIVEHVVLYNSNTSLIQEVPEEIGLLQKFCDKMTEELKVDSYSIREHQDNGLDVFIKCVNELMSLEDALKNVEATQRSRTLKTGNRLLLEYLYENKKFGLDFKRLQKAVQWHYQNEKIYKKSYLGYVANVINNPLRPRYGESKPYGITKAGKEWRGKPREFWENRDQKFESSQPHVELALITNNGVKKVKMNIDSARMEREFLFNAQNPEKEVHRNTRHYHDDNVTGKELRNEPPKVSLLAEYKEKMCISPFKGKLSHGQKKEAWSLSASFAMERKLLPKKFQNPTVLGVDLGWRIPAAYAIINAEDQIIPIENGILEWKFDSSIFSASTGKATEELEAILKKIAPEDFNWPKTLTTATAVKSIAGILRKQIVGNKDVPPNLSNVILDQVERTIWEVSPHFATRFAEGYKAGQGKLSYERMEMLESLKRMLGALISVSKKNDFGLDPKYKEMKTRIQEKLLNLKIERSRIVARMIIDQAKEFNNNKGVNVIGIEDINVKGDNRRKKFLNRGSARWCVQRIIKIVEDEAPFHGIHVEKVNPYISSHQDVDGSECPRTAEINPQTIPEVAPKNAFYPSISSLTERLSTYARDNRENSKTAAIYQKASKEFLKGRKFDEILYEAKERGETSMMVPLKGSEWIMSRCLGKTYSDVVAAQIVAQRAVEKCAEKQATMAVAAQKLANG